MNRILCTFFLILFLSIEIVYASEKDVLLFFNEFIDHSNKWDLETLNYYSKNPIIKRNVLNKTQCLVIVPVDEHKKMLKNYNKHKNLLKGIKNNYKNKSVLKISDDKYKITAQRCPTIMNKCFGSYVIIQKQNNEFKIIEEYSDVQSNYFLKFKDKK